MKEEEAIRSYFRRPGFARFLQQLERQYTASKEGVRGYVTLVDISNIERSTLDTFYKIYSAHVPGEKRRYSLKAFARLLKDYRYELTVPQLLELLNGEPVVTRREQAVRLTAEWQECVQSAIKQAGEVETIDNAVRNWAQGLMEETSPGFRTLKAVFVRSPEEACRCLRQCLDAMNSIMAVRTVGGKPIRLPILSAMVTGDAHALDWKNALGRLFWWGLVSTNGQQPTTVDEDEQPESTNLSYVNHPQAMLIREGYRRNGVIDDDLSSQVMIYAPVLFTVREERVLTLRQVERLSLVQLGHTHAAVIYMVENPSVFAELIDAEAGKDEGAHTSGRIVICGNGQLATAVVRLLDALLNRREATALYYSGDMDLAGLGIAQSLQARYPHAFRPWCMDKELYLRYAHRGMPLSEWERTRLLEIQYDWDTELAYTIHNTGVKLHQELWMKELLQDLD